MKSITLIIQTALLSLTLAQAATTNCGVYLAQGVIKESTSDISLLVNEGSQSEYNISFTNENLIKLTPYIEKAVTLEFEILERQTSFSFEANNILKIENRIPAPLFAQDTFLKLITPKTCSPSKKL